MSVLVDSNREKCLNCFVQKVCKCWKIYEEPFLNSCIYCFIIHQLNPYMKQNCLIPLLLIIAIQFTVVYSLCDPNCAACIDGSCSFCIQGYYLHPDNKYCYECLTPNCKACDPRETCSECLQGFKFHESSQTCIGIPTITNCASDSTYTLDQATGVMGCDICQLGYYRYNGGISCQKCSEGCSICTSSTTCSHCFLKYFLQTLNGKTVCQPCASNCDYCSNSYICSNNGCSKGYYLTPYKGCAPCSSNCNTCTDQMTCVECEEQYYLDVGLCSSCESVFNGCKYCDSPNQCRTCMDGFWADGNGQCIPCQMNNCKQCISDGTQCTICQGDYTRQVAGAQCLICPQNCINCESTTVCTSCVQGFVPQAGNCVKCQTYIANCEICSEPFTCTFCQDGFYLQAIDICNACPISNCQSCSHMDICLNCNPGYVLSEDKSQCLRCDFMIPDCLKCANYLVCEACSSGYYLKREPDSPDACYQCFNIHAQCLECTQEGVCTKVVQGSYIHSNGSLVSCSEVDTIFNQCLTCTADGSQCTSCEKGFFLTSSTGCQICDSAIPGCLDCSDQNTCRECSLTTYLDGMTCSFCNQALKGCNACQNGRRCESCQNGYYLRVDGRCRQCPTGCTMCSLVAGDIQCSACSLPSFVMDFVNKKCLPCNPGCLNGCITSTQVCQAGQCVVGYDQGPGDSCIKDTKCTRDNCIDCEGYNYCAQCKDGYFALNGECIRCFEGCIQCLFDFQTIYTDKKTEMQTALDNVLGELIGGQVFQLLYSSNIASPADLETQNQYYLVYTAYKYLENIGFDAGTLADRLQQYDARISNIIRYSAEPLSGRAAQIFGVISPNLIFNSDEIRTMIIDQILEEISCGWCIQGYYKYDIPQRCFICTIPNCLYCSGQDICSVCQQGFYGPYCLSCDSSCQACSSNDICDNCYQGYQLSNDNKCLKCVYPCRNCDENQLDKCLSCLTPYSYIPDNEGHCFMCDQRTCRKCSQWETSLCYQCEPSTILVNGRCESGLQNCLQGYSDACITCSAGYLLENGVCVECPLNCGICSSSSTCVTCLEGFYVSIQGCKPCPDGCKICQNQDICIEYEKGMIKSNNQIVQCRIGCDVCDSSNPAVCLTCSNSYLLVNKICKPCPKNCLKCSDLDTCTQCEPRSHKKTVNSIDTCQKCKNNCETCQEDDLSKCLTCKIGFSLVESKCKRICKKGCSTCSDSDICQTCSEGYTLTPYNTCLKCLSTCSGSCDPKNINICTGCADGFYLKNNACSSCPSGCASCTNKGECELCIQGFVRKNGVCSEKCKSPCKECNGNICIKCIKGFTLLNGVCEANITCNPNCYYSTPGTYQNQKGLLKQCSQNCATCEESQCLACFEGFYLNENSQCQACNSDCKICTGPEHCDVCAPGFMREVIKTDSQYNTYKTVYGSNCEACSSECATCFIQPDYCQSCHSDKKLVGRTCISRRVVVFVYVFNTDYNSFLFNIATQKFLEIFCQILRIDLSRIVLSSLKQGSTMIEGSLSADSQDEATYFKSVAESLTFDYPIEKSEFGIYYDDKEVVPEQDINQQNQTVTADEIDTKFWVIIGTIIGSLVLILIISIIVYRIRSAPTSNQKISQDSASFESIKFSSN